MKFVDTKLLATPKDATPVKNRPKFDSKFDENLYDLDSIKVH